MSVNKDLLLLKFSVYSENLFFSTDQVFINKVVDFVSQISLDLELIKNFDLSDHDIFYNHEDIIINFDNLNSDYFYSSQNFLVESNEKLLSLVKEYVINNFKQHRKE